MNQPNTKFTPLIASERIDSPGVIRGIALFGILLMNINGKGLPFTGSNV
jgi:uncharacterized protein